MKEIIVVLALLCLAELAVIVLALRKAAYAEEARKRAVINGQRWDWTKEDEAKVHAALELICDKCHEPFRCSQDELDAACAMCSVPDVVRKLRRRDEA